MIRNLTFVLVLLANATFAQLPLNHAGNFSANVVNTTKERASFSVGAGNSRWNTGFLKDSAFVGNGWQLNADAFLPVFKKLGFTAALNYARQSSAGAARFASRNYRLSDGTLHPSVQDGAPAMNVLTITAGPQWNWNMGRFSVMPSISAGYTHLSRPAFSVSDSIAAAAGPGRYRNIDFLSMNAVSTGRLAIIPKLKLGVRLMNNFSVWTAFQYFLGPNITTTTYRLQPLGDPAVDGSYNYGQYVEGKAVSSEQQQALKALSLQAGISFAFTGRNRNPKKEYDRTPDLAPQQLKQQADTGKKQSRLTASAPLIIAPGNNIATSLRNGGLQLNYIPSDFPQSKMRLVIWKLKGGRREKLIETYYPAGWNGRVEGRQLKIDSTGISAYEAQLTAFYQPAPPSKRQLSNKTQFLTGQVPVYDNNGYSNTASFYIQNNCTVDHSFFLDSSRCINGDTIRIWGHVQILPNAAGVTTGIITFDPAFLETTTNTSVPPLNMHPGNAFSVNTANPVSFNFDVAGDMCNKQLRVFYDFSYQCPTLNMPAHIPCADTISLPCCICNYCDDPANMNIVQGTSTTTASNGALQIQQDFSVTPLNITKVTAELVYISESVTDDACRSCSDNESAVYHFMGTNNAQWNNGSPVQAVPLNQSQSFPAKALSWSTNHHGSLSLNMSMMLPGLAPLSCCTRELRFCIRYSFTNKDCRVCERLVCYDFTQQSQIAVHQ